MDNQGLSPMDPSSYSRPELAAVTNIAINWTVNFDKKILDGKVDLTIERIKEDIDEILLDAKDLKISEIRDNKTNQVLDFTISEPIGEFGSKLTVKLPQNNEKTIVLTISYATSPTASGFQWLQPEQTAGKQHPYLFTQFQAIHARSALPCQDTPAVKTKYTATVQAPKDLTVLMSAIPKSTEILNDSKLSQFEQTVPMPSYLIALAVGAIESRQIGPRSRVWAEKELIESCAYEFAETEHQLKTAEDICGPYVWGIYDLLVLPPSFPFGGMENPCLTFVTPTLLAGDRSLANVVAHEIAHSWTGNLITNRNFEHFWLNEGFTVFVERKIKGRLTSAKDQDFDAYSKLSDLREGIKVLGKNSPLTELVVNLKNGVHPDDAFSIVPYEKGQTFLRYLETTIGGSDKFEPFLRAYFHHFKYKSIVTNDFQEFFENYFANNSAIKSINWNLWLHTPGMPPVIPDYDQTLADICDKLVKKFVDWNENSTEIPINLAELKALTPDQLIYFLQKIEDSGSQSIKKLETLDNLFGFSKVRNSEIKFRWYRIGLRSHWEIVVQPVLKWVNEIGRMKFVRPLYRQLYAWEAKRQLAIDNFKANRKFMMHVTAYTVAKDLHLNE